jgi:peptidoglycan/LPS O-acetylase OafA/YrhL
MKSIASVQALRAVAAISVALCHFNLIQLILSGRGGDPIPFYFMGSGVDLFFVISGFIMVHSSDGLFSTVRGPLIFVVKRLARIVPMYWTVTIASLVLDGRGDWSWASLFQSFFFIPYATASGQIIPLLGVGWTLNYEMFFYALFALALLLPRMAAVPFLCATLFFIGVAGREVSTPSDPIRFWFDPIVIEFTFGMALALVYRCAIILPSALRIFLVVAAIATIISTQRQIGGAGVPSGYRALFWGVPAAMIFAAAVFGPRQKPEGSMYRAFASIGDASYSIYLLHTLIASIAILWGRHLDSFPLNKVLAVGFFGTILVSLITYRFIERPAATLLSQLPRIIAYRLLSAASAPESTGS